MSEENQEEIEKTPQELELEEKRRTEWEKLNNFLKSQIDEMIDIVVYNSFTNFYTNDVASLDDGKKVVVFVEPWKDYVEHVSLIDLNTVGSRYIMSASWHCQSSDVMVTSYLSEDLENTSLTALWSLSSPLRPKVILDCEDRVSAISFCPIKKYTNIIVAGCLSGKVIIWEINEDMLLDDEDDDVS